MLDPLGVVVAEAGEDETVLTADVMRERIAEVRETVPVLANRRFGPAELLPSDEG